MSDFRAILTLVDKIVDNANSLREAIFILVYSMNGGGQLTPHLLTNIEPEERKTTKRKKEGSGNQKSALCQVKNDRTNKPAPSGIFQKFYVEYPKHVGRGAAVKAFDRAMKKATPEQVTDGARKYAEWCKKTGRESRFIPNPATWLNQERWLDDLPEPDKAGAARRVNELEKERRKLVTEFSDVSAIDLELQQLKTILY